MAAAVLLVLLVLAGGAMVLAGLVTGAGRRARPEPSAALAAARRHESITSAVSLAGGALVAVLATLVLSGGPWVGRASPPGLYAALAPFAAALVLLTVRSAGELTWPRPVGTVRSAALVHRSVRDLAGRRLRWLVSTVVGGGVLLAAFGLTADPSGRAVPHHITAQEAAAGYVGGASGPYPGFPYGVPVAVAGVLVLAATLTALRLVARRPAVAGTRPEDDLALRRTSARHLLGGVQLLVGGALAAVVLVASLAMANAGHSLAAVASTVAGLAIGAASLGAAMTAAAPRPRTPNPVVSPLPTRGRA